MTSWTIAHQAPLSIGFPRQEYWSGLPFPSPGDLPDPEIEPRSSALQVDSLPSEPPGKLSDMMKKSNRQAKVKRIQHHQTSFTINAKGTSPDRKHKRRKRPTQDKPKAIKKLVIGSYILISILNVNRLNATQPRDTD